MNKDLYLGALPKGFVSEIVQIGIVTKDFRRAIAGFLKLGIGPWQIHKLGPETVSNMTYRGALSPHVMTICLASTGSMEWEIIQPIVGPTIYDEFLAKHGEGIHHVALKCGEIPWSEKVACLEAQGFRTIQSGCWLNVMSYAYFESEVAPGMTFEIWDECCDFVPPEPDEWWPARPQIAT